jgi:heterodisulfide reductase subunit D
MQLDTYLRTEAATLLDKCTACGKCIEVCPNLPHLPEAAAAPDVTAAGVLNLLRDVAAPPAARSFVEACCGSARCREVCPEGLDAYDLMRLAKVRANVMAGKKPPPSDYHLIDVSRKTQLGPVEPRWYTRRPPTDARAEYVFYMGCNIMRTPHIALGVMAILDLVGLDYATVGGGANCCGIKQFRVGLPAAQTVSENTLANFGSLQPKEVVSWCPTCEVHFNDFGASYLEHEFPINLLSALLVRNLDEIRPHLKPLPTRVVVEVHAKLYENDSVQQDVATLLSAIPGLELVQTEQHVYGYQCSTIVLPEVQRAALDGAISEARRVGADALVSVFHGCHRFLVKRAIETGSQFEVVNWVSLLGRSLGIEVKDRYRAFALLGDEDLILEEALALDAGEGIPIEKLREAIRWEHGT